MTGEEKRAYVRLGIAVAVGIVLALVFRPDLPFFRPRVKAPAGCTFLEQPLNPDVPAGVLAALLYCTRDGEQTRELLEPFVPLPRKVPTPAQALAPAPAPVLPAPQPQQVAPAAPAPSAPKDDKK